MFAWDSLLGTSDIGHTMTSMVGTDPAQWPAQTPLAHADKINIPLLILHWEGDLRVPFEQAQRMFAALRARRAPVELMVFPGGDHGVSRAGPPDHRADAVRGDPRMVRPASGMSVHLRAVDVPTFEEAGIRKRRCPTPRRPVPGRRRTCPMP